MCHVEFSGLLTLTAPGLDELSVLIELQHTGVAHRTGGVALSDEDVAITGNRHIVRLIKKLRRFVPISSLALRSKHHQKFSLRIQFHYRVRADVSRPDI